MPSAAFNPSCSVQQACTRLLHTTVQPRQNAFAFAANSAAGYWHNSSIVVRAASLDEDAAVLEPPAAAAGIKQKAKSRASTTSCAGSSSPPRRVASRRTKQEPVEAGNQLHYQVVQWIMEAFMGLEAGAFSGIDSADSVLAIMGGGQGPNSMAQVLQSIEVKLYP